MQNMSRNIATAAFIAASGMGHADEAPDLTYAMLQPNFVLYDTLAHTDLVFIEAEKQEGGIVVEKLARYDHAIGVLCQWDKVTRGQDVTLSNPECVIGTTLPEAWTGVPAGQFGDYLHLLGDEPRYSHFSPDWIIETFGAVNLVTHNALITRRIWDMEKSVVCLSMEEGYQVEGNEYATLDFGCFPIREEAYANGLAQQIALQP